MVKSDFSNWRQHKQGRDKIPDQLWNKAIALAGSYKSGEIVKSLRLSGGQFAARQNTKCKKKTKAKAKGGKLKSEHTANFQIQPRGLVTINKTDGNSLTINTVTEVQFEKILSAFLG